LLPVLCDPGLSLDPETFTKKATYGPHLLAPTATDLVEYGKLGAIFAGFHTVRPTHLLEIFRVGRADVRSLRRRTSTS
jgi:hypothetical protein